MDLRFYVGRNNLEADATNMIISAAGNVGIGTTSPGTLLHLSGGGNTALSINTGNDSGDNSTINFGDSADGNIGFINYDHGTNVMQFSIAGERMRITSTGLVGIGTSSPHRPIHQHVSTSGSNYHQFTNSTTGSGSGDGGIVGLVGNEDLILWHQESQNLRFGTSNTERMRVQSSGGISFNGDTAAANALDDYEEGTFTPEYNTGTSGSAMFDSCNYNNTTGEYTKVGRLVTFAFRIQASNIVNSNAGSQVIIVGLPFTSLGSGGGQGGAEINYSQAVCSTNNGYLPTLHIANNSSNIMFFTCNGNAYGTGDTNNNFTHTLHIHGQSYTAS